MNIKNRIEKYGTTVRELQLIAICQNAESENVIKYEVTDE